MTDLRIAPVELSPASATDQVFDALYDAVITVALSPGTKVSEADIAKQLNVSRQPVRDAFFRLSKLGFLSIRPQRATLITQISQTAVINAIFVRTALESECLRSAMAHNAVKLQNDLQAIIAQQESALANDAADFHALDEKFHEAICRCAGHPQVWTLIREQKAHLDRIRFLTLSQERRQHVIEEHQVIVDAIKAGEFDQAERHQRDHISAVTKVLPEILERFPEYFD